MPADLPNLRHAHRASGRLWSEPWICAHCGHETPPRRYPDPDDAVCPARVAAWGAEQRAAGAAEERARIVEWLRARASNRYEQSDVCNYVGGNTTAAYAKATEAEAAADAIERGEDRTWPPSRRPT